MPKTRETPYVNLALAQYSLASPRIRTGSVELLIEVAINEADEGHVLVRQAAPIRSPRDSSLASHVVEVI